MNGATLRTAVIVGSTRQGRFGPVVADWAARQVDQHHALQPDLIDLAEVGLPAELPLTDSASAAAYLRRLDSADAFVIVTPEYNHSFPASLKHGIDAGKTEWYAKPVAFVCYGGISGGLRAVEHLRGVFAELHAVTMRDTVSFHRARRAFTSKGDPIDEMAVEHAKTMLDRLTWWGRALRSARLTQPY